MQSNLTILIDRQLQLLHERLDGIVREHKPPRAKIFAALEAKRESAIDRAMSLAPEAGPLLPPVVSSKRQGAQPVRFGGGAKREELPNPQAPNLVSVVHGGIHLLPVISTSCLSAAIQMKMIHHEENERRGANLVRADSDVIDRTALPQGCAWWLVDVEDGRGFLNESPEAAGATIEQQERLGFVASEVIALGMHTNVLTHHGVLAPCSWYRKENAVPGLRRGLLNDELNCYGLGYSDPKFGIPSCKGRI